MNYDPSAPLVPKPMMSHCTVQSWKGLSSGCDRLGTRLLWVQEPGNEARVVSTSVSPAASWGHSKSRNRKWEMGNEKWETRKWGNGTATHKWQVSVMEDSGVYMLCSLMTAVTKHQQFAGNVPSSNVPHFPISHLSYPFPCSYFLSDPASCGSTKNIP